MTLCNLTIEMGCALGLRRAGRCRRSPGSRAALARRRARCGIARWRIGARCASDDDASVRSRDRARLHDALAADHLGHRSEPGARHPGRVPDPAAGDSEPARGSRARADLHGAAARARRSPGCRSTAYSSAPAPTRGCLICSAAAGSCAAAMSRAGVIAMVVPGSRGEARGGSHGSRPCLPRCRLLLGRIRLLDVRGREWRPRRARRALRIDHQPQFRKPPRPACARISSSPATAAATAIAGRIADVRQFECGKRAMQPSRPLPASRFRFIKDDINTDQIAPVPAMRISSRTTRELFFMRAPRDDGSEDPDFVLNKPQFRIPVSL